MDNFSQKLNWLVAQLRTRAPSGIEANLWGKLQRAAAACALEGVVKDNEFVAAAAGHGVPESKVRTLFREARERLKSAHNVVPLPVFGCRGSPVVAQQGCVKIDYAKAELQRREREWEREDARRRDEFGLGLYGPTDGAA